MVDGQDYSCGVDHVNSLAPNNSPPLPSRMGLDEQGLAAGSTSYAVPNPPSPSPVTNLSMWNQFSHNILPFDDPTASFCAPTDYLRYAKLHFS